MAIMCDLLGHKNEDLFSNALKFLGQVLLSTDISLADKIIFNDGIEKVTSILYSCNTQTVKQGLWLLSNLTANGVNHCQAVSQSSALPRVISLTQSYNVDVQQEALWVICNMVTCGKEHVARDVFLAEQNAVIPNLLKGLRLNESRLVVDILASLHFLLLTDEFFKVMGDENSVYYAMQQHNAYDFLEPLSNSTSQKVFDEAQKVIELFDKLYATFQECEDVEIDFAGHEDEQLAHKQGAGMGLF
mmetsp:Transcript_18407/g.31481  ORF Transcript_18407/g.31481 Transcript_18407/m.31481 type:complete len:245 (+) Transcript_18407:1242-1976(+)